MVGFHAYYPCWVMFHLGVLVPFACRCVLLLIPGVTFMISLAALSGLSIFAFYASIGCDPLRAGFLGNPNQVGRLAKQVGNLSLVSVIFLKLHQHHIFKTKTIIFVLF